MREKILAQLKIGRAQSTSPSDRTLETLATILSATITEESQIEAAIEPYNALITDFSGETSHAIAEALKKQQQSQQANNQQNQNQQNNQNQNQQQSNDEEPAWAKKSREAQEQKLADIENRFLNIQKKEQSDKLVEDARKKFNTTYKISESEKALLDKSIAIELQSNPNHESVDSLVAGIKSQYEDLRSAVGLGGVEPIQNNGGGSGNKEKPMMKMLTEQLKKEGKIPIPQQQN